MKRLLLSGASGSRWPVQQSLRVSSARDRRPPLDLGGTPKGVDSGEHFKAMNAFIAAHWIGPVIDRGFTFDDAEATYGHHFGKVINEL